MNKSNFDPIDAFRNPSHKGPNLQLLALARFILRCNRQRIDFMPGVDWADRSWDILLDLYATTGQSIDNSALAIGERHQMSEAISRRYISLLIDQAYLDEVKTGTYPKNHQFKLSLKGVTALEDWLRFCIGEGQERLNG